MAAALLAAGLASASPASPALAAGDTAGGLQAATVSPASALLMLGSRGDAVADWQRSLNGWLDRAGRPLLAVDGIFGPFTDAATRSFQRSAGITVDGIVGPVTRDALAGTLDAGCSFDGTVGISEELPTGEPLALTGVRFGVHEDFDRVVLDLEGDGQPGWTALYVDSPVREQGSGNVIPLAGDAWLQVSARGMGYPMQTGVPAYGGPERVAAPGAGVVEDIHVGTLFEGRQNVVLGLSSPEEFRVLRLESPPRLVVDVLHPGC